MKKLILIMALAGIIATSYAQTIESADVPAVVVKSFNRSNHKADSVVWSKVGDFYKATYPVNKMNKSITYSASGKLKQTEMQVKTAHLPTPVLKYINENYPGDFVKSSAKVTTASGKSSYAVKIKDTELVFDSNGKYLKPTIQ
jgi:uncharacterized protein (DUF2249 family)